MTGAEPNEIADQSVLCIGCGQPREAHVKPGADELRCPEPWVFRDAVMAAREKVTP